MSDLDRARNPDLTPAEFKELLDLNNVEIYEALDLNQPASERYIAYLDTLPEVQYFPEDDFIDNQTLIRANGGDHLAQFAMAIECKDNGDEAASKEWFRKSAENGNVVSAFNYAITLEDPEEQLEWLYQAAFKGFPEAQREVGRILYEMGDVSTAKIWFGLAIRRESVVALNDMGVVHWRLDEIEEAASYWNRAAALGSEDALANLEMASTHTLFDDEDFDFDYSDNTTIPVAQREYAPPREPAKIREERSSSKEGLKRL
jgi:TPR repeat protein